MPKGQCCSNNKLHKVTSAACHPKRARPVAALSPAPSIWIIILSSRTSAKGVRHEQGKSLHTHALFLGFLCQIFELSSRRWHFIWMSNEILFTHCCLWISQVHIQVNTHLLCNMCNRPRRTLYYGTSKQCKSTTPTKVRLPNLIIWPPNAPNR